MVCDNVYIDKSNTYRDIGKTVKTVVILIKRRHHCQSLSYNIFRHKLLFGSPCTYFLVKICSSNFRFRSLKIRNIERFL